METYTGKEEKTKIKKCVICGKEIKVSPSQEERKKCCSYKCDKIRRRGFYAGKNNPAYKGGKVLDKTGYVRMRGKARNECRYEHQVIMEKFLGRPLKQGEEVHHINGVKDDNRLENLFVLDKKDHSRKHFELFILVQKQEAIIKMLQDKLTTYIEKFGEG